MKDRVELYGINRIGFDNITGTGGNSEQNGNSQYYPT